MSSCAKKRHNLCGILQNRSKDPSADWQPNVALYFLDFLLHASAPSIDMLFNMKYKVYILQLLHTQNLRVKKQI